MAVLYDIKVESGASQWYGVISVTNIRYADGSAVRVNDFLGMGFHSPASVQPTDFNPQFWMWTPTTAETTNDQIDSQTWDVTAKLIFELGHTFAAQDKINIGINGDLTGPDAADYLSSFALAADTLPNTNGIVSVQANSAPDERLYSSAQTLYFTQGTQVHVETVAPGTTTPLALPAGTYSITASPLSNHAGTVVSTAHVQPSTVTVTPGSNAVIMVVYDPAKYTAALDVSIGDIPVLADELLDVTVVSRNSQDPLAAFSSPPGHLTQLHGLPLVGVVDISVASIAVNNVRHTFPSQHRSLDTKLQFVAFTAADMHSTAVSTAGFVTLPVVITSDVTVNAPLDVRLVAPNMSYHQTFHLVAGTHSYNLAVPVQPQTYAVEVSDFIYDGVVYNTQTADYLVVLSTGKAQLHIDVSQGANLKVRGFPDFLSFGGCADLTPGNAVDFVAARASSVFKYAGFDGAGDPGQYLTDDAQTTRTILLARDVEQQIGGGHKVLPVMVSYTCNLSLGDTPTQLANTQGLAHSFGNLILSLNLAKAHTDVDHPVPCGFVVNPDFLGACQQGGFAPDYAMPVREPLRQALAHWKVVATIPQNIEENIRGYVAAVNWLIRTVAPAVTFGWQVNLWGVGASEWIYASDDSPVRNGRVTAAYVRALKVHEGPYAPDFLAVDRYEADDFTIRAYANGYCYWVHEWKRFFDFCAELSRDLKVPIMPWQVPASHAPLVTDPVNDNFDTQNWGTGGTYILGDPAIGSDYHNINPKIIALQFPDAFHWAMGTSAEDMFERSIPFDVSAPAYGDFPYRGIFTLLLGGGATTGIISTVGDDTSFVRDKLNAYMDHPIPFGNDAASLGTPRPQRRLRRRGLVRCGK
jgi:hypothetical protein